MEDYLIKAREELNKPKDFLNINHLEENSKFTMRILEPYSTILAECSSQNTPESDTLEISLDLFHNLVNNNNDPEVCKELGTICATVLSAIERTKSFEVLFFKLLAIINDTSKNNLNVWSATARQILNVFINKKFSPGYLESVLKSYAVILRNVDQSALLNFSLKNLHLLKTLSMLVEQVGDFETQFTIMDVIFLHLSKDKRRLTDFFGASEESKTLFQSLTFDDFRNDCRVYLNSLNKPRRSFERRVYTIGCWVSYFGDHFVAPALGQKLIWVDANKETERLSIECSDFESEDYRVIYLTFSEIAHIESKSGEAEGTCCITIQTKNLRNLYNDVENDNICLVAESGKEVSEFVSFLESVITKKRGKFSKTEPLFIDLSLLSTEGLQVDEISSSVRLEVDTIHQGVIKLFEKSDEEDVIPQTQIKAPLPLSQERKTVLETQDSPVLTTLKMKRIFQSEKNSSKFLQWNTHQLEEKQEAVDHPFGFVRDKENKPLSKQKTYSRKSKTPKDAPANQNVLREGKQSVAISQDCFRQNAAHKKPSLPKLNRKKKQRKKMEVENNKKPCGNEYEALPLQEVAEQSKPSLLDPNGYGFQRWLQNTTSEKSNFWLRKLAERNERKENVFEFTDSDSEIIKKPKRRVVHSKRRYRRQNYEKKRLSLKHVTEFLRNKRKPLLEMKKPDPVASLKIVRPQGVLISSPSPSQSSPNLNGSVLSDKLIRPSTTSDSERKDELAETQKRDRSEEENSLTRLHKKKIKIQPLLTETFLLKVKQRLQRAEDKARQQTNEIIETINKVTCQLLNHLQQKEETKITSYLNMAEEASRETEAEVEDLQLRVGRFHRVVLFFRTEYSVVAAYQSIENHLYNVKASFKDLENKTDAKEKINHVTDRLKTLIQSGIDKFIENEIESKRNQLLKYTSVLGTKFSYNFT